MKWLMLLLLAGVLTACPARIPLVIQELLSVTYPTSDPCKAVGVDFLGKTNGIRYSAQGEKGHTTNNNEGNFDVRFYAVTPPLETEEQAAREIGSINVTCLKPDGTSTSATHIYTYRYLRPAILYSKDFR